MKLSEELTQLHNSGDCGLMVEGLAEKAYQLEQELDQLLNERKIIQSYLKVLKYPENGHVFTHDELTEHDAQVIEIWLKRVPASNRAVRLSDVHKSAQKYADELRQKT